jgi:CPA2 family monovalent cation:H+ antiporter-2
VVGASVRLAGAPGSAESGLLVEFGLVLLGLGLLGLVARRFGVSVVPLYLLAGLAFGSGGLLPLSGSSDFIRGAAELGIVLLMLTVGLEFTGNEFVSTLRRQGSSGLVDLVLNAGPGLVVGLLLGVGWLGAVALAGVTWVSSSGIAVQVLGDLGRLANRETPAVLSVLVLEDIAMAVYLPVVAVLLGGGPWWQALLASAGAVGAVVTVAWSSMRFQDRLTRAVVSDDDEQVMLRVLGITLLVAGLTQVLDASAAVGAFLVGLALTGRAAERARAVLTPLRNLFAAVFFLSFGLATDPSALVPVLPAAAALALVTAGTKIATGWYAAARVGASPRGRLRAGSTLVARGEFSILVAGLAEQAGLLRLGAVATGYVIVLAVVGPLLARYAVELFGPLLRVGPAPA